MDLPLLHCNYLAMVDTRLPSSLSFKHTLSNSPNDLSFPSAFPFKYFYNRNSQSYRCYIFITKRVTYICLYYWKTSKTFRNLFKTHILPVRCTRSSRLLFVAVGLWMTLALTRILIVELEVAWIPPFLFSNGCH